MASTLLDDGIGDHAGHGRCRTDTKVSSTPAGGVAQCRSREWHSGLGDEEVWVASFQCASGMGIGDGLADVFGKNDALADRHYECGPHPVGSLLSLGK